MYIKDVYKEWAADYLGINANEIESVSFSSYIGDGSPDLNDPDFSTFAGQECWSTHIHLTNNKYKYLTHYDENPVRMIMAFVRKKKIEIEFDSDPTVQDRIEQDIRS